MRTLTTEVGDLLLIEVPESAEGYLSRTGLVWYVDGVHHKDYRFTRDTMVNLGVITKDGPQFECEELVESMPWARDLTRTESFYKDYKDDSYSTTSSSLSFVSLLNSQGVYLKNPLGQECPDPEKYPDQVRVRKMIQEDPDRLDIHPTSWSHDFCFWHIYEPMTLKEGYKFIALLKTN